MKKRILSLLLTLVMILGMIPATTLTANAAGRFIEIGSVDLSAGYYLEQGSSTPTTTKPEDNYAYFDGVTLELHNYTNNTKILASYDYGIRLFGYNKVGSVQAWFPGTSSFCDLTIRGNGTLCVDTIDWHGIMAGSLSLESGNLDIITTFGAFYGVDKVTCPEHPIALGFDEVTGTWESFDLDKLNYDHKRVMIISGAYFGPQSPAMPEGSTSHDLGKVSSSEYVMTFASQDMPSSLSASGYKVIEQLVVYDRDNNGKIVDTVTNNPTINGTGISYSLKNLPSGNYTIRESIIIYDKDGKAVLGNNNDFILEVENTVNNINVRATFSGTPAKATTSSTGATVTATKWYKKNGSSWTQLGASDTIKEGNTYRCEVTVGATGTYTLADGYTVKINGIAATKKSGNTWYRDITITGYTSYVDVYDIALPEAFTNPDFTYNDEEGAAYHWDVVQVEWFECDKDGHILSGALTENGVFQKDTYYRIEVTVVPETNWQFHGSQLSFYINGKAAMPLYGYNKAYPDSVTGYVVYHVDDANGTYTIQIGDITLKDGDYLANNATSVTTVKPVGGYAYYKDGVLTLNNFVAAKLVRYYERYLEVELIGENKIGAIADYYYWDGNASNNYYTGLEFRGDGNLEIAGAYKPYSNISVNGDVFFNGSGDILFDAEICCFQYTDNVIINDGYVYCYTSQDSVFMGNTIIEVNGGKLKMLDGGSWNDFTCNGTLTIAAGNVYVSADPSKTELADCVLWDGVTDLNTYDCVWIVGKQEIVTHTVTFKVDTTTVATKTVEDGKTVTAPADPTQSGKTFLGWYTDGGTKFDFTTPITGDITLTAKFEDATSTVKLGDVNGDGFVDIIDLQRLYAHLNGSNPLGAQLANGDVNGDTFVDIIDLQRLYAHLNGSNLLT